MAILPKVNTEFNICILFRALNIETDLEIMQLIVLDSGDLEMQEALYATLYDGSHIGDKEAALDYIGSRICEPGTIRPVRIQSAERLIHNDFLPHVGIKEECNLGKAYFLGLMVNRLMSTKLGRRELDDRDHYANKRIDLAGPLCTNLFRQVFGKLRREMRAYAQRFVDRDINFEIETAVRPRTITDCFEQALKTGNWEVSLNSGGYSGVAQVLNRLTYCATLSHLRRVNTPIPREARVAEPRLLHNTQWGIICPSETPEGQACGLVKNLALSAYVTCGQDTTPLKECLRDAGMKSFHGLVPSEIGR